MSEITFVLLDAEREDDFRYIAVRANPCNSVARTDALDVEAVSSGEFYDKEEEIRVMEGNLMTLDELEEFMRKNSGEVRFNDPEIQEIRDIRG